MKKLFTAIVTCILLLSFTLTAVSCGPEVIDDIVEGQTNITVGIYSGGYGTNWIDGAIQRFEAKYAETSFEEGKKGVHVIPYKEKSYTGSGLSTTVKNNVDPNIYFAAEVPYYDLYNSNALLEITDLVKNTVNDQDGKTIESKLSADNKAFLQENGKYYALPLYEAYHGVSYDAGVFKSKKLYFSNELDNDDTIYPGTNKFIVNANTTKSCGPDGVYGTYDDGLPSTIQEFYKLIDKMTVSNVTPFVFTFNSDHYSNNLMIALYQNLVGANGMRTIYKFDSKGEELEIVTGFNDDNTPKTGSTVITKNNANKIKSSLALYYASEFCNKVFSDSKYYDTENTATTHLDAMERFMKSGLDGGNYIGMLLDGTWWYNEASDDGLFKNLQETYSETYTKKDFRFMPFPHQYAGTVTPRDASEALAPVLTTGGTYAFISSNIPSGRVSAAKAFLSFCYSDQELLKATEISNGVLKAVNYDFSSITSELNTYAQSILDMRAQSKSKDSVVEMVSKDPIFLKNASYFRITSIAGFLKPSYGGQSYESVYKSVHNGGFSTKQYFEGLQISDDTWTKSYLN